ncbi:MAG: hypothetical protein IKJ83_03345 [Ruminococcus sp.]|nr:hypothetical protein [Ruminococcus sp.]
MNNNKKPFYKKWWFYLLITLLFVGIINSCTDSQKKPSLSKSPASITTKVTNSTESPSETSALVSTETSSTKDKTETTQSIEIPVTTIKEIKATEVAPTTTNNPQTEKVEKTTIAPIVDTPKEDNQINYVLNTNTCKFHYPSCSSVKSIKSYNREDYYGTRDSIINRGYEPCGRCHP